MTDYDSESSGSGEELDFSVRQDRCFCALQMMAPDGGF